MKKSSLLTLSIFSCAALAVHAADAPAAAGPYHFIKEIHLGGLSSTDYLTVDPEGQRLYVSHGTTVTVVDIAKDEVVGDITGQNGVHGIAIAAKAGLGFISNRGTNSVNIFDLKTLKVTKSVGTGTNPDWIMYEPSQNEVYAFNGGSQSATVIDVATGEVTATIPLGGKPESATVDVAAGRIYDNLEDKAAVAVIDIKTHKVVATWPNAPAGGASGQAIDLVHHRLFLGCDDTMAMMDSTNGKVLDTLKADPGIDSAAFDPGTGYAFVPGGQTPGGLVVAKEDNGKLTLVQNLVTAPGAKTIALDPTTHRIFTATSKVKPATPGAAPQAVASTGMAPARPARPTYLPDSFEVLVYGMDAAPDAKK